MTLDGDINLESRSSILYYGYNLSMVLLSLPQKGRPGDFPPLQGFQSQLLRIIMKIVDFQW